MKEISFAGHKLILHYAGLLIWPAEKLAVVSDLHLEKGSFYAAHAQLLPAYETRHTLEKLSGVLDFAACETVIFLGDSFHDSGGYERMDNAAKKLLYDITKRFQTIWVIGNHDREGLPKEFKACEEYLCNGIVFRHEAHAPEIRAEISGHYHPKSQLVLRGKRVSRPCFLQDASRIIMPAFGSLTGGLDICDQAFEKVMGENVTAHLLGQRKIYTIPADKICA